MKSLILSILLGCSWAGVAFAESVIAEATLESPITQPKEMVVKGVTWRCEGSKCFGTAERWPNLASFMKRCSVVSAAIGPLAAFRASGRAADKSDIATCNRLAKK